MKTKMKRRSRNANSTLIILNKRELMVAYMRMGNLRDVTPLALCTYRHEPDGTIVKGLNRETLRRRLSRWGIDVCGFPSLDSWTRAEDGSVLPYQLSEKARENVARRCEYYGDPLPDYSALEEILANV